MSGGEASPAVVRLALSRERLRLALGGTEMPRGAGHETSAPRARQDFTDAGNIPAEPAHAGTPAAGWLGSLLASPLAEVLIDTVSGWWLRHPLRPVVVLGSATLTVAIKPVAQRHPLALMAGAILVGGLLAWARPWRFARWALRPALFAGLAQQLLSRSLAELPLQAWLTAWAETAQSPPRPGNSPMPQEEPAAAAQPGARSGEVVPPGG